MQVGILTHRAPLSEEAKACIRRYLGEEADALIAAHEEAEQPTLGYQDLKPDRVDLAGVDPEPAPSVAGQLEKLLSQEEGHALARKGVELIKAIPENNTRARFEVAEKLLEGLTRSEQTASLGRLGLAALGQVDVPEGLGQWDSLLDRSLKDFRKGPHMFEAAYTALTLARDRLGGLTKMVDAGEAMVQTMEPGREGLYAGIRVALAAAGELGELSLVSQSNSNLDFPLHNLKSDWESPMIAMGFGRILTDGFASVRAVAEVRDAAKRVSGPLQGDPTVSLGMETVDIGGVSLAIEDF